MKKFKIWWYATIYDFNFYRVIYLDSKRTSPISRITAKNLKSIFGGKIIIDYEYATKYFEMYNI